MTEILHWNGFGETPDNYKIGYPKIKKLFLGGTIQTDSIQRGSNREQLPTTAIP